MSATQLDTHTTPSNSVGVHTRQITGAIQAAMGIITKDTAAKTTLRGFSTGLSDLDSLISGFKKRELIVLTEQSDRVRPWGLGLV